MRLKIFNFQVTAYYKCRKWHDLISGFGIQLTHTGIARPGSGFGIQLYCSENGTDLFSGLMVQRLAHQEIAVRLNHVDSIENQVFALAEKIQVQQGIPCANGF